jgi:hypothetical protein
MGNNGSDPRCIRIEVRQFTRADMDAYIRRLLDIKWNAPDAPIRLADNLSLAEVGRTALFESVRTFLRLVDEGGGAGLTVRGNLNRACVAQMMEEVDWLRRYTAPMKAGGLFRKFDEADVMPLGVMHGVCEFGRLIRHEHGRAVVTPLGRRMRRDERAGELYRRLFVTLVRDFDLGYVSTHVETPFVQHAIAVTIWRLSIVAREWANVESLPREVFLTSVLDQVEAVSTYPGTAASILRSMVLRPLGWLGLLEFDPAEDETRHRHAPERVRLSRLFSRVLWFCP